MSANDTCDTFSANILIRAGARARVFNPNTCHMCHRPANGEASMRAAPQLFTLAEVAERLHKSPRWMQYFLRDNPFGRMAGRTRLFTEEDIAAIIEALPCPSKSPGGTARPSGTCAVPSEA